MQSDIGTSIGYTNLELIQTKLKLRSESIIEYD